MKLSTATLIGCVGLFAAGFACFYLAMSPAPAHRGAPAGGGTVEDLMPPRAKGPRAEHPAGGGQEAGQKEKEEEKRQPGSP